MPSRRKLILKSLGLPENDDRLPVHRVEDKRFEDYAGNTWLLTYREGSIMLRSQPLGVRIYAEHLSDLIVFYSQAEFSQFLKEYEHEND